MANIRRLWTGILLLGLGIAGMACASEPEFGTFNLRTRLFRALFRPFGHEPARTRLPIVLAHGICGFDRVVWGPLELRYFRGIEQHLRKSGFDVLTTDVPPTGSIEDRAQNLARQIRAWRPGPVNVISHSMGGLDTRYMIAKLGMGDRVASLTMIGTPNRGTLLCDWLEYYGSAEYPAVERLARFLGIDTQGFHDLSVGHMMRTFNPAVPDDPRVTYRSFAGAQKVRNYFAPLMITHALNRALEKTLAGRDLDAADVKALAKIGRAHGLGYALSKEGFREALRNLPSDWLIPDRVGRTDGMVSMSSAHYGSYMGDLDADHLDAMGWLTTFDAKGFYEAIARNLAAEGF